MIATTTTTKDNGNEDANQDAHEEDEFDDSAYEPDEQDESFNSPPAREQEYVDVPAVHERWSQETLLEIEAEEAASGRPSPKALQEHFDVKKSLHEEDFLPPTPKPAADDESQEGLIGLASLLAVRGEEADGSAAPGGAQGDDSDSGHASDGSQGAGLSDGASDRDD